MRIHSMGVYPTVAFGKVKKAEPNLKVNQFPPPEKKKPNKTTMEYLKRLEETARIIMIDWNEAQQDKDVMTALKKFYQFFFAKPKPELENQGKYQLKTGMRHSDHNGYPVQIGATSAADLVL